MLDAESASEALQIVAAIINNTDPLTGKSDIDGIGGAEGWVEIRAAPVQRSWLPRVSKE
jgi:hypothetical protein